MRAPLLIIFLMPPQRACRNNLGLHTRRYELELDHAAAWSPNLIGRGHVLTIGTRTTALAWYHLFRQKPRFLNLQVRSHGIRAIKGLVAARAFPHAVCQSVVDTFVTENMAAGLQDGVLKICPTNRAKDQILVEKVSKALPYMRNFEL